jgi:hypothetical protein
MELLAVISELTMDQDTAAVRDFIVDVCRAGKRITFAVVSKAIERATRRLATPNTPEVDVAPVRKRKHGVLI